MFTNIHKWTNDFGRLPTNTALALGLESTMHFFLITFLLYMLCIYCGQSTNNLVHVQLIIFFSSASSYNRSFYFSQASIKTPFTNSINKKNSNQTVLINICSIYLLFVYLKDINIECNIRHKKTKTLKLTQQTYSTVS